MVNLREPLNIKRLASLPAAFVALGFLCFIWSAPVQAQDDLNVHGVVSDAMTSAKLAAVDVTVMKDGKQVDKFSTRANGKYEFYLSCGAYYIFYFEKPGFVRRSIEIDSRNIPKELIGAGIIMPTDMSMFAITPAMEGADLSVFDKPIGKAAFDPGQSDLVWDFNYTQKIKGEINTFIRNLDKKKKEESAEDKAKAAAEAEFAALVKAGDDAMAKSNYDEAVAKYSGALDIKGEDQNVKAKLGDAETKRNQKLEAERVEKAYSDAIAAGDAAFKSDNFDEAIAKYQEALVAKPNEAYPKQRIDESNRVKKERAAELAKKAEYDAHMAEANNAVEAKDYSNAIAAFEKALGVKAGDKDATSKRDNAQALLKAQQENAAKEAEYAAIIKKADDHFAKNDFAQAKTQYQAALAVVQKDAYATERVATCDTKIAELAQAEARQREFDQLVAQGDVAVAKPDYPGAIAKYEAALAIFADKAEVKTKLKQAQDLMAEANAAKEQKAQYDKLIADADKAFGKNQFEDAKALYTQAREVKGDETYPLDQLNKIKGLLDAQAAEAAAKAAYDEAMQQAREAVGAQQYDAALAKFDAALKAKPGDASATKERESAAKLKAEYEAQQAADKAYNDAVAAADAKFSADQLDEAAEAFKAALKLKAQEKYPQEQIDKIKDIQAKRADEKAEAERLAALQKQVDEAFAAGENAMAAKDYPQAISRYDEVLKLSAAHAQAAKRKGDAENLLAEQQQQQALNDQYASVIKRADEKFAAKAYPDAREAYEEALRLKAGEDHPKKQLALIDERIAADAKAAAEAELKAKNEQVAALLSQGDQLVGKKEWDGGIGKYNEALGILPDRADIRKKIADAEAAQLAWLETQATDEAYTGVIAKADAAFGQKDWDTARRNYKQASEVKPAEKYPKDQLALIDKREKEEADAALAGKTQQVNALLDAGDKAVAKNDFDQGLLKYDEALGILPDRADIRTKISDAEAARQAWLESQATGEAYAGMITKADAAFAKKDWDAARSNYKQAGEVKPAEKYPKDQLALIDQRQKEEADAALAGKTQQVNALLDSGDKAVAKNEWDAGIGKYNEALGILPDRADISKKIADAEAAQLAWLESQATGEAYAGMLAQADAAFAKKDWDTARRNYKQASDVKPTEKYPKDQLALIDRQEKDAADAERRALQDRIAGFVNAGDQSMSKKDFEGAILQYENALDLDPARADIEAKVAAAQQKMQDAMNSAAVDAAYADAITLADKAFGKSNLDEALVQYTKASGIKPGEKYPKEKIAEIESKRDALAREASEKDAMERQKQFDALLGEGDGHFGKQKYDNAIEAYDRALAVKPESQTAQSKRATAQKALDEMGSIEAEKRAYDAAIAEGDALFNSRDYEMSRMQYEDALALRANEKYPAKRIGEIDKILEKQQLQEAQQSQAEREARYSGAIKRGDAAMASKKYDAAIGAYTEALDVKPDQAYPQGQIERANLLIRDKAAEEERLAAEREAAERRKRQRPDDDYRTVSTKSEEQAEAFMRDALAAQEREKYERIKKLKTETAELREEWESEQAIKRNSNYAELLGYNDVNKQISDEGMERYEQRTHKSQGYKSTLLANMEKQSAIARIRSATSYKQIEHDATAIRNIEYKRQSDNLDQLREVAREMRLFTEEYGSYYRKKNEQMVDANSAKVQQQTETFYSQLDERKAMADVQRSKNLEDAYSKMSNNALAYTEFFRMALAQEYPQGVTEESSTMGNKVIITRIVVKESKGDEYKKVLDRAGNYYFKNGQSISENTWNRETLDAFYKKD